MSGVAVWGKPHFFRNYGKMKCLIAIREALGEKEYAKCVPLPVIQVTEHARVHVPPTGWAPPWARGPDYDLTFRSRAKEIDG